MNRMQLQVKQFHIKFDQAIGDRPALRDSMFRADLIEEEAKETVDNLRAGNIIEAIDGMCDLLYVVFGTAVTMGIDLEPFFDEVHRTNMLKEGGGKRCDGKVMKPLGWEGPRIVELLEIIAKGGSRLHYPPGMREESQRLHREYKRLLELPLFPGSDNAREIVKITDECNAKGIILVPGGENL